MITVTINSNPSTIAECYAALQTAIGSEHPRWAAMTDDLSYITAQDYHVVGAIGGPSSTAKIVYRNDRTYNRFRKFGASGTTGASIPVGTVFKVFIFPES